MAWAFSASTVAAVLISSAGLISLVAQPPADPTPQPTTTPAPAQPETPKPAGDDKPKDDKPKGDPEKLSKESFGVLSARSIGPALLSGRVGDFAFNPRNHSEFYVAACSGNVWKTTNGGVTFSPIFDRYGSFSIGCLRLDPSNPAVLWVGTGENNSQRSVSWGDGVYVSRDAGKSFTNVGLQGAEHIGMIQVDPRDSNVVYVAAQGPLWNTGGERGLYKTINGGQTWSRILHVSDDTGINEVHFDPRNADVLYATAYQRRRHVWTLINGGPESAFYKSTDAGKTWRKIDTGLPGGDKGRMGLAVSPVNPDVLYMICEAAEGEGGVFRSRDRGETWEKRSGYMATSPQYYNELVADPRDVDRVYSMDTFMQVSDDGGASFRGVPIPDVHVDFHALWIDPGNTDHLIAGCDGGVYETFDRANWRHAENLPVTQFYRVAVDNSLPFYRVYGGTQDNNTFGGPSRTLDRAGITNEDWFILTGGDGFEAAADPDNPNIVYCESQDGYLVRYDHASGEEVGIRPREKAGDKPFVFNWDTPLIVSPHKSTRLYYAGNFLFRSEDRGDSWTRISEDLTRGLDRNQLKVMGKVQKPDAVAKHMSTSIFGNAVSLTESPLVEGLIYDGTDDGLVHVTEDGGKTWRKIENFPVVPDMSYVSDLEAGRHNKDTVFATFDNHKMGDFLPYVLRSDDRGRTWKSIAGDLPKRDTVYAIIEDHVKPEVLFVGTEYGAYFTIDGGQKWKKIGGLPTIAVRDLEIQRRENDLVMATFGRGFYIVDDYTPLRHATAEMYDKPGYIFPVKKTLAYQDRSRLGGWSGRGWSGADYFATKNPPIGATFTFFLKESLKTLKEKRKEAEKKDGWKYPTMDEFRAEEREPEPGVFLTIRDASGAVVRRLDVPHAEGMHRVTWDLRYPETSPIALSRRGPGAPWEVSSGGTMVPPGKYTAQLSKVVNGVSEDLGAAEPFEVVDLNLATLAAKDAARADKFAFERRAAELQRAVEGAGRVLGDAQNRVSHLIKAVEETPGAAIETVKELDALRLRLLDLSVTMYGDPVLNRRMEPTPPSITERVYSAIGSSPGTTQPVTGTQREQYDLAAADFEKSLASLKQIVETDLPAIEKKLEAVKAPWTPGRLPEWKK